jgi:tetratricopeptide (TPR) repeat protein
LIFAVGGVALVALFLWLQMRPSARKLSEAGQAAVAAGDNSRAIDLYSQWIRLEPNDPLAFCCRGHAYIGVKDYGSAISDLNQAIQLYPRYSGALALRSTAYLATKQPGKALDDVSRAIDIDPSDAFAHRVHGDCFFQKRDFDRAIRSYDRAIALDPKTLDYLACRGGAYIEKKDYASALADYSQALRLDRNYIYGHLGLGFVYFKRAEYDRAQAEYAEVIRLAPQKEQGYNDQAWMWATCPDATVRNGARAVEYATKACELSQWQNFWCLGSLAAACAETGQFEDAIKWQQKALDVADGYAAHALEDASKRLELYKARKPFRDD